MSTRGIGACVAQALEADGAADEELKSELRSYPLLELCRAMRECLCDVKKIQPAMRLLASAAVNRENLSKADVQLLFTFFAEKLSQVECQTAALGCLALLTADVRERFPCTVEWFRVVGVPFTSHVRVQQLPVHCRRQCFCIMAYLFTEATLPACSSGVLNSLLELMDGESDPELVLQTFDLHVVVATRASKTAFATVLDDYFESISSYFPVVFSQPPGCRVTKMDLRTHLKRCLCLGVFSECCIPFMQGKLASPSIAVKEDVIDVLLTCFDTYQEGALTPYHASLVTHMKNEVVKLSSFADRSSNPTLTKCLFMCCEVLGRVSRACVAKNQSEILEVFGPVVEGFLSALSADTSVCSAYATMVFHVLTGSWECCLHVASYLFSMLSMSLEGPDRTANAYILFAALVAGMLDALVAFPGVAHVKAMRAGVERSTQPVADAVLRCSSQWATSDDSGAVDDFAVACGCEFVVSVLKLSRGLDPWLTADVVCSGIDALVWAAVYRCSEVSAKVCKLLRSYADEDGDGVRGALSRLLRANDIPASTGLAVVCELASTSPDTLLLAYQDGFLSPTCTWMRDIAPDEKAAALQKALEHFGDSLQAAEAERMTAVLCRADVPPAYFQCACFVAENVSDACCVSLLEDAAHLSLLGLAAFAASGREVRGPATLWTKYLSQLQAVTTRDSAAWRRVGMEGITGVVRNGLAKEAQRTEEVLSHDAQLLVAVAKLWGSLLTDPEEEDDGGESRRHGALVSAFAQEFMSGGSSERMHADACVVEAFTYLPFLARQRSARPSLLHLLLNASAGQSWHTSASLCTAVRCLVDNETDARVQLCLPQILDIVSALTQGRTSDEGMLARSLLFSTDAKCQGNPTLARSVLLSEASMQMLLGGASDTALTTRCRTLLLVTSLARGANAMAAESTAEEKSALFAARDRVLVATKVALADHKRKVRQAAAACRHEWYKVK